MQNRQHDLALDRPARIQPTARRDDREGQADQDGKPERDQRDEYVLGEIIGQEAQRVGGPLIHARPLATLPP